LACLAGADPALDGLMEAIAKFFSIIPAPLVAVAVLMAVVWMQDRRLREKDLALGRIYDRLGEYNAILNGFNELLRMVAGGRRG